MGDIEKPPRADETKTLRKAMLRTRGAYRLAHRRRSGCRLGRLRDGAPAPSPTNPFISHAFLSGSRGERLGHAQDRLAAASPLLGGWRAARCSAPCPAISNRTRKANMSSTMAGPTPMSARAAAIIRSSRRRSPSRPSPGRRLLVRAGARRDRARGAAAPGRDAGDRPARRLGLHIDLPHRARNGSLPASSASSSAPTSNSIGGTTATRRFDDFLAALASRKRKTVRKERREALRPASPSNG